MAFNWFDARDAETFGQSLAQFFIQRIPPAPEKLNNKALAKQMEAIDKMYLQIAQFKQTHKLNIYKKAMLARTFKYALTAAGHKPEFVDQVTKGLIQKL